MLLPTESADAGTEPNENIVIAAMFASYSALN